MPVRMIVDTDIGLDVDDALALAFLLGSKDAQIELVTTVHGDVTSKCWRVLEMLHIWGKSDIPVVAGCREPLLKERSKQWDEREREVARIVHGGKISPGYAPVRIVEMIFASHGEMTLLCLGPLTNIAIALRLEPIILSKLHQVVIMGGAHHLGKAQFHLPLVEYNIGCDPEAAAMVFSSDVPITLVTLDVTESVRFGKTHLEALRKSSNPLASLLCDRAEMWLALQDADSTALHDPLAAAVAILPDLVSTTKADLRVECKAGFTYGQTVATPASESNTLVSMEVDSDRFMELFLKGILQV